MTVAVFGASGFVGQNMVKGLKEEGLDVLASDIKETRVSEDVNFVKADILDFNEVCRVVREVDKIIHLAASPLPASIENPKLNMRINVEGTLNIMDAARKFDIDRIIFSSASSIYGEIQYNPVDEEHPCTPRTPYAVAKHASENYFRVYQELYELDYLIFRFFNIYGPEQYPESGALVPMIYKKLTTEGSFDIFGDGSQTRDFVYVEDLVDVYIEALRKGVKNEIINLGTGEATSIKELVELSADILGISPDLNYKPERPGEIDNFVADTEKLKKVLGLVPSTPIEEGLKKTFSWLERQ